MILSQTYETVRLDEVERHPANPRQGDVGAIFTSIVDNGFYGALIVQRSTGRILAGNHRYDAAREAGLAELPAIVLDVDDDAALRILLVDNRVNDLASYDDAALLSLLISADDLTGTGYSDDDLEELRHRVEEPFAPTAPTDTDVLPVSPPSADPVYSDAEVIEEAFAHYRQRGFPYPALARHECMQRINQLAAMPVEDLRTSRVGYHVPDSYHPERFVVRCNSLSSPVMSFERDDRFRYALGLLLENGSAITDGSVLGVLGWVKGGQAAAQFRPGFALWYLRRFCPVGGRVLDTSAGWGGRLVGYAASDAAEYVGIDPSESAIAGNARMIEDLTIKGAQLIESPAEDVPVSEIGAESFDFALTSPPYFAKEHYSDEPTQSFLRYPEPEAWRTGFLVPMLALQHAALKSGATSVVNIADVKLRKESYPLTSWAVDAAISVGFEHVATEEFPMPRIPGRGVRPEPVEPVLIFRKP